MFQLETSTRFSKTEIIFTISLCTISRLFLVLPSVFIDIGTSSAILLAITTIIAGLVLVLITCKLYENEKFDIITLCRNNCSRAFVFGVLSFSLIINVSLLVRGVAESIKISLLPDYSIIFITILFAVGFLVCSLIGLKSTIRSISFILPFTIIMLLLLCVLSIRNIDFNNIFPIFGNGGLKLLYGIVLSGFFGDFVLISFLLSFSENDVTYKSVAIPSFIITSVILTVVIALSILALPQNRISNFFIPIYRIAQYINIGGFMLRTESIFTICWVLCFFETASVCLYVLSMITGRLVGAKSNRYIMVIYTIIVVCVSFIPKNTSFLVMHTKIFEVLRFLIQVILPICILFHHKRGKIK